MPLLIYGADVNINEDFTLEKLLDDTIVDPASWTEFMPTDVTKSVFKNFIKYYDSEIFIAAGRSIRNKVKGADMLNPTERINAITQLLSGFKNPDTETVLTPWRVVNMHMSDCLGGYDFYDIEHNKLIEMPRYVDRGTITTETLANCNAQILEINSKTGLYPLYVTYSIYRTKCAEYTEIDLTLELQEKLWNDTVANNLFVICKTPMAKQITKRTLVGYKNVKVNAHYFEDLINMLKNKPNQFKERVLKPSYWWKEGTIEMKFDAIVGNPPYQENIENRGEQPPLYHMFYESSFTISDIVSLITPARFLFEVGKTPSEWNFKMLNDRHFKVVKYFPTSKELFDNVDIKGGVAIGLRNSREDYGIIERFIPDDNVKNILSKVLSSEHKSISRLLYSNTSYKYTPLFFSENISFASRVSGGSKRYLSSSVFDKFHEVFFESAPNDGHNYIKIIGRQNSQRKQYYIDDRYIIPPDNFANYKVLLASSNGSGILGEALSPPIIADPYVGATETFISFGKFKSKEDALNLEKYIKTKFTRLMLGTKKVTQGNKNSKVWNNVPLQDFTSSSDIDWRKSVAEIDKQLYAKYDLTNDEITFIEKIVKPME